MSDEPEIPLAPSDAAALPAPSDAEVLPDPSEAEVLPDPSEAEVPPPPPEDPPALPPPQEVPAPPEGEGDPPPPPAEDSSKTNVAENPEEQAINRSSLTQSTRSYMFLDSVDASVLYEKDGNWVLEKIPDDVKGKLDNTEDNDSTKCMERAKTAEPREPHIVSIDAVTGNDTIPCNLCDQGQCLPESELAPAWLWMYDVTTQMITLANEYKKNMLQSDASCGEAINANSSLDDRLVSSKGTQHTTIAESDEFTEPPEDDPEPPPEPPMDFAPDTADDVVPDRPADTNDEAPADTSPETPEDFPPEAPKDSSAEVPAEAEAAVEVPVELPPEEPAEPPKEASAEVIPVPSEKEIDDPPPEVVA